MRLFYALITFACLSIVFPQQLMSQQVDWVRNGGGGNIDEGFSIDVDANGNSYATGRVNNFPTNSVRFGNDSLKNLSSGYDMFLVKYNRQGDLQWTKSAGGTGVDAGTGVSVNGKNLIFCGIYNSTNAKLDTFSLPSPSFSYNLMVSRMDTSGSVKWVKGFNIGSVFLSGQYKPSVTQDNDGNIYATGYYNGSATFGSTTLSSSGSWDVYVVKLDSNGTVKWAKSGGSTGFDYGTGIDLDSKGNVYFTAIFSGTTFTMGSKSITRTGTGFRKALITKLDTAGLVDWFVIDSATAGTTTISDIYGITIDRKDQIFVAGAYFGAIQLDTISITGTNGSYDLWISKFDTSGSIEWLTVTGGTSFDQCFGLNTDDRGNVGVTGRFFNNCTFGTTTLTALGFYGIFYALLDSTGSWTWAQKAGGGSFDQGNDIALDSSKNIYATGQFTAVAAFGDKFITSNGNRDVFVAKFTDCSDLDSAKVTYTGSTSFCSGDSLVLRGNSDPNLELRWLTGNQSIAFATDSTYAVKQSGDYRLLLDDEGCIDTSDVITVKVNTPPKPTLTSFPNFCAGNSDVTLTQGSPTGGVYKGTGIVNDTVFSPTASGVGTFNIFYVVTDTAGCSDSTNGVITVGGSQAYFILTTTTLCENDAPLTLTGGIPAGGTYFGTGVSSGQFDPSVAGAGTHTLSYVYTAAGCSDTATQSITVLSTPNATFSSLPDQCSSTFSIDLSTYTSPSGGSYFGTAVIGNTFYPLISGAGTFSLGYVASNGTCVDTALSSIKVEAPLNATLAAIGNQCITSPSFTLTGGAPAGGVYSINGVIATSFNPASLGVGTHTVTYKVSNICGPDSASVTVTVNAQPTVTLGSFSAVCSNSGLLTLSGGSPSGGTYFGNNISSGQFNPLTAGGGTHTINYTYVDGNGCSDTASQTITVNASPTVTLSAFSSVCIDNGLVTLSGGSPTPGTYSGTGVSGTSFNPVTAGVGTHTITYKHTDGNSCSDSATQTITVNALPTVSMSTLSPVCITASSFALSGGSPSGGTYSGTGVSSNSFDPATAGVGTHKIYYTYTDGNGCTNLDSTDQVVNGQPTVTLSSFSAVCSNSGLLTLSGGSPSGGTYFGNNISSGQFNPLTAGGGTHTINYTYTDGNGCSDTASQTITVNASPTVTLSSFSAVCIDNGLVTLSGGSPTPGTYSGTGVSGTSFNPVTAGVGTHTITYKHTDGNSCSDSATQTITVNALPTVSMSTLSSVCITASSFTLSGGSPAGGTYSGTGVSSNSFDPATAGVGTHKIYYTYTDGNGCTNVDSADQVVNGQPTVTLSSFSAVCSNSGLLTLSGGSPSGGTYFGNNISSGQFNPLTAGGGTHTINYTYVDGNGCSDTASQTITVNASPTVTLSSFSAVCIDNGLVTLSGGSPTPGTYSGTGVSGTSFNPVTAGVGTHTITYKHTDGNSCSDSATQTITVNALPTVTMSTLSPVCITASSFTLSGGSPAGGTYSGTGVSSNSFDPATAGVGTHKIYYTYTDGNGCTNVDSTDQVVNGQPTVTLSSFSAVCSNSGLLTLSGGSPSGGTYFGNNISSGQFNPLTAGGGTHTINYTYTDGNGCSDTASQTITVNASPTVTLSSFSAVCIDNGLVTLSGGSPTPGTYSGTGVSGTSFNPVTAGVGTHAITYKHTDGNSCSDSATQTITVNALPTVTMSTLSPVCITASSFTLSGGSPSGGAYSGTGVSSNSFDPATAGVGTHKIYYTYTNGNGCTNVDSTDQVVNGQPTVTLSSFSAVCSNSGLLTLSGGSPSGGTYFGNNISSGQFNPLSAGGGTHTINYTYSDGNGCSDTASQTITVNASPTVTLSSFSAVCIDNGLVTLSGGSPTPGTYSGTGVSGTTFNPVTAGVGTHTITYKHTDGNSCSDSATQTITVNALPTVTMSSLSPVCITASSFTLSGGSPAGGTYSGTGVSSNSFDPATAGVGTHKIYYTYTDGNGCTNVDSTDQVVNGQPTVTLSSFSAVCSNSGLLTLSGGSPSGGTYFGNNISSGQFNPLTAGGGTHTINYTYTDGNGCSDTASQTITVNASPTVTLSSFSAVCIDNGLVTLSGGSPTPGTYSGTGVSGTSFNPVTAGVGTHTITYKHTDGNSCSDSATQTITVNALPTVTMSSLSPVCITASSFTLSGGSPAGGTYSGTGVSSNSFDPATAGVGTHKIYYTYTDGNGCTNVDSTDQVVNGQPTVTLSSFSAVCSNSGLLTLSGGSPSGGTYFGNNISSGQFNPLTAGGGTHTINYTYTDGNGCSDTASQTITVNASPTVTLSSFSAVCIDNGLVTLSGGSPTPGTYSGTGVSGTAFNPVTAGVGTHTITYKHTDGNSCSDSATQTITVNALPTVTMSSLSPVCITASSFTLSGGSPSGGTYSGTGVSSNSFDPATAGVGTHKIYYTYTDGNGCTNVDSTDQVVNGQPTVTLSSFSAVCSNSGLLTLSGGSPSGGAYFGNNISSGQFNPLTAGGGTHTINYTYTDGNGCSDTASQTITVDTVPIVSLSSFSNLCANADSINLTGGTPSGGVYKVNGSIATSFNPATYGSGAHTIRYVMTDANNCSDSASQSITVDTVTVLSYASLSSICNGVNPVAINSATPVGGTYSGFGVVNDTLFDPGITGNGTFTIKYKFTNAFNCQDSITQTIGVDTLPSVSFQIVPDSICENSDSLMLQGQPAGGVFTGNGVGVTYFNPMLSGKGYQKVTYTYTGINGCSSQAGDSIRVDSVSLISFNMVDSICYNSPSITLSGNGIPAGGIYKGDGVSSGVYDCSLSGKSMDSLYYVFTNAYGCMDSSLEQIRVDTVTLLSITPIGSICGNDTVILNNAMPSGGNYSGSMVLNGVFNAQNIPGKYGIQYEYTNHYGCTDSIADSITVKLSPSASLASLGTICANTPDFKLTNGLPLNGTYLGSAVVNDSLFSASTVGAGSHLLRYAFLDTNGCSDTANLTVNVDTVPLVQFTSVANLCANGSPYKLVEGTPSGGVYSGTGVINDTLFDPSIGYGSYALKYFFTDANGCADSANSSVDVDTILKVDSASFMDICASEDTILLTGGMPSGGFYVGGGSYQDSMYIASIDRVGIDTVYYVLENQCGRDSMAFNFEVRALPNVSINLIPKLCLNGDAHPLTEGVPLGGTYLLDGAVANSITTNTVGIKLLQYFYMDSLGCSDFAEQQVEVKPLPQIAVALEDEICSNVDSIQLTLESNIDYAVWNGDTAGAAYTMTRNEWQYGKNEVDVVVVDLFRCTASSTASFNVKNCGPSYEIWPNPSNGEFSLVLFADAEQDLKLYVTNSIGQEVMEHEERLLPGRNQFEAVFDLGAGTYIIHMELNGEQYWEKLVIR